MKTTIKPTPRPERIHLPRWRVSVPGWRELVVEKLHIEPTYLGFLEGRTESINRELLLSSLPRRAGIMVGATSEDEVIPFYTPPLAASAMKRPLPDFACLALLYSKPVKNETLDDETASSRCVYGWFTSDLSVGVEELLRTGIRRFAWEKHAVNCWF